MDERALDEIKDAVVKVLEAWDPLRQDIAYKYLYTLGIRIDGVDWRIKRNAPRLAKP